MAKNLNDTLTTIRRAIHCNPELGNCEFQTTNYIKKVLKGYGIKTRSLTKTGLVALVKGSKITSGKPKCLGIRADIDALPILEKTKKTYSSKNPGVMHACGHDANTAIAIGALILLAENRKKYSGTIKFIFQPNEEAAGGASSMIDAGVLNNPKVDAIVGVHVNPWLKPGIMGLKQGEMMAAVDKFTIDIIGTSSHGAYPHKGQDAIVIAAEFINSVQSIVSREIDPVEPVVITIGMIEGGSMFNILAGAVKMTGTVRTLDEALHKRMKKLIERKLTYITKAYGAKYKLKYEILGYPLKNNNNILELCRKVGINTLGSSNVKMLEKPSMGGEDFSEYLRNTPGCFIFFGSAPAVAHPWHSEFFDIDESMLAGSSRVLSEIALKYLS